MALPLGLVPLPSLTLTILGFAPGICKSPSIFFYYLSGGKWDLRNELSSLNRNAFISIVLALFKLRIQGSCQGEQKAELGTLA